MAYKAVHIVIDKPVDADLLYGLLSEFEFEGFEEQEGLLTGYIPMENMPVEADLKAVLKHFSFNVEEVEDRNWNAVWESNFQPVSVGAFCGIRADFHPPFQGVQHEIIINPRMSFGTGHHATTQMMIRLMQFLDMKGKKVLDFGTGTGILSILAGKMGADKIVAIDNDRNAVDNAAQNIKENPVSGISLFCREHVDAGEGTFDVILANINRNVILNASPALTKQLRKGGQLLLSGFLREEEKAISQVFQSDGLHQEQILEDGEWAAVRLHKE